MLVGLVPALARAGPDHRFRLICSRANVGLFTDAGEAVERVVLSTRRRRSLVRIWQDQAVVPWLVARRTDVLFTPSSVGSIATGVPQVVAMQTLLALPSIRRQGGGRLSAPHRFYYGPIMRLSHRRATVVTPTTEYLAQQLIADTRIPSEKVESILLGIEPMALKPAKDGNYALVVGTLWPYKNVGTLIDALAIARTRLPGRFRLLVAGRDPDGRQMPALRARAATGNVEHEVEFLGHVEGPPLDELYRNATVVVFPSRLEGFGLPALEAMARGVPVIASNRTALPEVVGDAGLLVDPDDAQELADRLAEVASDPDLRERLSAAGRRRADELSWDRAARSYIRLFERVAAGKP
ncbi:MAG TPA: glycosyltransferase family 1 protein [Acidimicrobiales bacterium]|nr:glycosyltransferase family 1 protein [Acidimicrobiales bacterium]